MSGPLTSNSSTHVTAKTSAVRLWAIMSDTWRVVGRECAGEERERGEVGGESMGGRGVKESKSDGDRKSTSNSKSDGSGDRPLANLIQSNEHPMSTR